jgi:hypothetical protein
LAADKGTVFIRKRNASPATTAKIEKRVSVLRITDGTIVWERMAEKGSTLELPEGVVGRELIALESNNELGRTLLVLDSGTGTSIAEQPFHRSVEVCHAFVYMDTLCLLTTDWEEWEAAVYSISDWRGPGDSVSSVPR